MRCRQFQTRIVAGRRAEVVEDDEEIELESELTWTAAVGANVGITERIALTGEVRYTPWSAQAEGDSDVRFRF